MTVQVTPVARQNLISNAGHVIIGIRKADLEVLFCRGNTPVVMALRFAEFHIRLIDRLRHRSAVEKLANAASPA